MNWRRRLEGTVNQHPYQIPCQIHINRVNIVRRIPVSTESHFDLDLLYR